MSRTRSQVHGRMFPIAAVTDCCKFSGLKHENVLSYNPRAKRSERGLTEPKVKVSQDCIPSGHSGAEPGPGLFQLLWLVLVSHLPRQQHSIFSLPLSQTLRPPSFTHKHPRDYMGPVQITSPGQPISNLDSTCSRLRGIGTGISLEARYSNQS